MRNIFKYISGVAGNHFRRRSIIGRFHRHNLTEQFLDLLQKHQTLPTETGVELTKEQNLLLFFLFTFSSPQRIGERDGSLEMKRNVERRVARAVESNADSFGSEVVCFWKFWVLLVPGAFDGFSWVVSGWLDWQEWNSVWKWFCRNQKQVAPLYFVRWLFPAVLINYWRSRAHYVARLCHIGPRHHKESIWTFHFTDFYPQATQSLSMVITLFPNFYDFWQKYHVFFYIYWSGKDLKLFLHLYQFIWHWRRNNYRNCFFKNNFKI